MKRQLPRIKKITHPLSVYTDFLDVPFEKLSEGEKDEYRRLNDKSTELFLVCRNLKDNFLIEGNLVVDGITFTAYDELFQYFEEAIPARVREYKELFKNSPVDKWKLEAWEHMLINFDKGE